MCSQVNLQQIFKWILVKVAGMTKDINLLEPELFFLILAHPVHKMWIIQEQNMLELWNKLHFEEEKTDIIHNV